MFASPFILLVVVVALVVATMLLVLRSRKERRAHAVHPGDYVASGGRLYRIEFVRHERVLIEDCGNGELFDAGVSDVEQLPVVKCGTGQPC